MKKDRKCKDSGKHKGCEVCHHNGEHEETAACPMACNFGGKCEAVVGGDER